MTLKTVDDWIRRGMPVLAQGRNGQQWRIDTAAVWNWYAERHGKQTSGSPAGDGAALELLDLAQERARQARETATAYALKNAQARRELIAVEDVIDLWGRMQSAAKRQFRGLSVRLKTSGVLPDLTPEQSAGVLRLIDEVLAELAGDGVPDTDGSAGESLVEESEAMGPAA